MTHACKCSATRADGRPCQAWALRDSHPPLCRAHNQIGSVKDESSPPADEKDTATLDFYRRSFTVEEITSLINLALASSLNGEVAASRIAIRRIMQQLEEELSPSEYAQLAGLIFTGANTIARLMRSQRALSGEAAEGIIGALAKGLDELSIEWRLDI